MVIVLSSLQNEEALLRQGRMRVAEGAGPHLAWNAAEFNVPYPSLATQLCIGGVYIRLLLDGADQVHCLACYLSKQAIGVMPFCSSCSSPI